MTIDALDGRLLTLLTEQPQIGVLGASRRPRGGPRHGAGAPGPAARSAGSSPTEAPHVDPAALGFPVTAFCTLEIRQGRGHDPVVSHLSGIPEVLEAHTITGSGDLWIRVVARDNTDLQRVIDRVVDEGHVVRASTVIALASQIGYRTLPLVQSAASPQE